MILTYTFRTCPFKDKLNEPFIFGKLKDVLKTFFEIIKKQKPELVIGIAKSNKSVIEKYAINKFNNGVINKKGKESYELHTNNLLPISNKPTNSFCNWTAYKISELIEKEKLNTKLIFTHIKEKDLIEIKEIQ